MWGLKKKRKKKKNTSKYAIEDDECSKRVTERNATKKNILSKDSNEEEKRNE